MNIDRTCFVSDNCAASCPEVAAALAAVDHGHALSYGEDATTARACRVIEGLFECDCDVYFVFSGTAANSLALASLCQSYHGVICHPLAHIENDECGGPEFASHGAKLLLADGADARIAPQHLQAVLSKRSDIHFPRPRALSLTQSTELGTLYQPEHIRELCDRAKLDGLRVHMDGARFANAVAALHVAPADITWRAGVDVLCFGGTKQGMPVGEAVVFFDHALSEEFGYRCKQAGQLASKMRYLAAPWQALLQDGAWLRHAAHANACAARLARALAEIPDVHLTAPCQANEVFVRLPSLIDAHLYQRGWRFSRFLGGEGVRFVCNWSTRQEWIDALVAEAREVA
ncbi:MAG: threonine aldolase family protein [Planctomycetota bacterium]